jgi:hypothetical protein
MPRRRSSRGERLVGALGSLALLIVVERAAFPKAIIVESGVIACVFAVLASVAFLWPQAMKLGQRLKPNPVNWAGPSRIAQSRPSVGEQDLLLPPRRLPAPERSTSPVFTPELLSAMEWRSFEILVTVLFQKRGYTIGQRRVGADGGVDVMVFQPGATDPHAYIQCKAWNARPVGVEPVRALFGVMAGDRVSMGYFVIAGEFSVQALAFAYGKPLKLITGQKLLADLNALPEPDRIAIMREITAIDYTTPTCPKCDVKMVRRQGKGPWAKPFWGCRHYPRCHSKLYMRKQGRDETASARLG